MIVYDRTSRKTLAALLVRQPLLLVRFNAFFTMKREVEEQLAHAIAQKQGQTFITKDALMLDMGEFYVKLCRCAITCETLV